MSILFFLILFYCAIFTIGSALLLLLKIEYHIPVALLSGFVFLAAVALYLFQVQPNKTLAGKLGSDEDYSSHLGQQQSFLRVCPRSSLQDNAAQGDCLPRRMMRWPVYFL